MFVISVNKKQSTGEWLASVTKDGKFLEGPTSYASDAESAVDDAIGTYKQYKKRGDPVTMSKAKTTQNLISKFRPDFSENESNDRLGLAEQILTISKKAGILSSIAPTKVEDLADNYSTEDLRTTLRMLEGK